MVYEAMDDIMVMEKLKLADMAALDWAISIIRIFKIGNLEHKIAPTKAAASVGFHPRQQCRWWYNGFSLGSRH